MFWEKRRFNKYNSGYDFVYLIIVSFSILFTKIIRKHKQKFNYRQVSLLTLKPKLYYSSEFLK